MPLFKDHIKLGHCDEPLRRRRQRIRLETEKPLAALPSEEVARGRRRPRKIFGKPLTAEQMRLVEKYPTGAYLSIEQAAYVLQLSPKAIESARLNGTGPTCVERGGRVVYQYAELKRWAAEDD